MKDRRSLVEGLKPASPDQEEREKAFVYGQQAEADAVKPVTPAVPPSQETPPSAVTAMTPSRIPAQEQRVMPQYAGRVPITTRTRPEVASAVKRAALTRQLDGVVPYTVQDIVEEALELWLLTNGCLDR
ncbi:MAG: hypothetical protein R3C59_09615 [Planctomycetaceae bacterium]